MKSIVYLSQASIDFSLTDLEILVRKSVFKNEHIDITGYLCFSKGRFLQYIEGPEENVNLLMADLRNDFRHKILYEVERHDHCERLFSSWSMRYITPLELSRINLENYVEQNLMHMKNNYLDKNRCRELIWKLIEVIAKFNNS